MSVVLNLFVLFSLCHRHHSRSLQPVGLPAPGAGRVPAALRGAAPPAAAALPAPLRPGPAVRAAPPAEGPGAAAPQGAAVLGRTERRPVGALHLPAHEGLERHRQRDGAGPGRRGQEGAGGA